MRKVVGTQTLVGGKGTSRVWVRVCVRIPMGYPCLTLIALTKEHQYHARTKHIDVRFHFIRWIVEDGKLQLLYCPTEEMVVDIFTKALVSTKVKHFASELGLELF